MSWFAKIVPSRIKTRKKQRSKSVPEGVWMKCPACKKQLYRAEIEKNLSVCNKCNHHMRIGARDRLNQFLDQESQSELFPNIVSVDPLNFKDTKKYMEKYNKLLRNITELIEKGLFTSKDLKKEVEDSLKLKMEIIANKLNLVSREEFEVQKKIIEKLQKKLKASDKKKFK